MTILSLNFLFFLFLSVLVYYLCPKKFRWVIVLITSIIFFLINVSSYLILYLLLSVISVYIGTNIIDLKCKKQKSKRIVLILVLFELIGSLFVFKYLNIIPMSLKVINKIFNGKRVFDTFNILAPLGISYYTLSLIGYVLDIYWGSYKAEKNPLKVLLFACFFPSIISGPILRYQDMKSSLLEGNKLDYDNIYKGVVRIIYGFAKKLIIADQLSIIVKLVFSNYAKFSGYYIVLAVIFYAIQIYADFSGCMDIVIGSAKLYGIVLPENFNSPFFSKNLSEFWRRWHISLGTWGKDYIMYPVLKSNAFQKLGLKCRDRFGKKIGKKIPTILSILILWLLIGLWHGASFKYIFAAGILPWFYLTLSQIFEPIIQKIKMRFISDEEVFSYKLFQSLRTMALMCIIWLFACSNRFTDSFKILKKILSFPKEGYLNEILKVPLIPVFVMCIIVLIVDYLKYKEINVQELFMKQNIVFRWCILFFIIGLTLIYGAYGPEYDASAFIYGGF